jgi:tRNA(guanine-26,N2-N2) methyltransferase
MNSAQTIVEGSAAIYSTVYHPSVVEGSDNGSATDRRQKVFYNNAQVINRDLTMVMVKTFCKLRQDGSRVSGAQGKYYQGVYIPRTKNLANADASRFILLEGLAASGLRSIRYFNEVGCKYLSKIVCNDLDKNAVINIKKNAQELNNINVTDYSPDATAVREEEGLGGVGNNNDDDGGLRFEVSNADVNALMFLRKYNNNHENRLFDIIDLDPYGSVSPFLDGAIAAVADGGLLAITSTDSAVLCGNLPGIEWQRYSGAMTVKASHCHEQAIRILLHSVSLAAARHKRSIRRLAGFKIDFYFRVFVQILDRPNLSSTQSPLSSSLLFKCNGRNGNCEWFSLQSLSRTKGSLKGNGSETDTGLAIVKPAHLNKDISSTCPVPGCHGPIAVGGPMWAACYFDKDFLNTALEVMEYNGAPDDATGSTIIIKDVNRIKALIYGLSQELPDAPLFVSLAKLVCGGCDPESKKGKKKMKKLKRKFGEDEAAVAAGDDDDEKAAVMAVDEDSPSSPSSSSFSGNNNFSGITRYTWIKAIEKIGGYITSRSHYNADAIKSNAPVEEIYKIKTAIGMALANSTTTGSEDSDEELFKKVKELLDSRAEKAEKKKEESAAVPVHNNKKKVPQYFPNPEPNWGPKPRAR